jgi:hypothetical protein
LLAWDRFRARHRNNPALEDHTLYAIPEGLVNAIEQEVPDLLASREKRFERDLACYGGVGFHNGQPIRFALLPEMKRTKLTADESKLQRRIQKSDREIRQLFNEHWRLLGRNEAQVQAYLGRVEQFRSRVVERQRGYVGWLLTNPDFRTDRDVFFTQWKNVLRRASEQDGEPLSLGQRPGTRPPKRTRHFWADAVKFLWKWGLQAMATPELPLPIDPGLERPNFGHPSDLRAAGTVLFIPWYLVIDKDMRLEELIENHRLDTPLLHLKDWLPASEGRGWGFERYGVMLRLNIWIGLALARRYPDRMAGQATRLDRAFARFELGENGSDEAIALRTDSIRRTRAELNRRLSMIDAQSR